MISKCLEILGLQPLISKIFFRSLEHFFLYTVGQNNFGSKILFLHQYSYFSTPVFSQENSSSIFHDFSMNDSWISRENSGVWKNDYIHNHSFRKRFNQFWIYGWFTSLPLLQCTKKMIKISNLVGRGYQFYCSSGFLRRPQKYEEISQLK